jgi:hypothetical protein
LTWMLIIYMTKRYTDLSHFFTKLNTAPLRKLKERQKALETLAHI